MKNDHCDAYFSNFVFKFITRNDSFKRWYPNFTIKGMRRTILMKLKSVCDEEAWRAYDEYSRNRDVNNQSVEDTLPKSSASRSR